MWRDRSYSDPIDTYEYEERHYEDHHGGATEEAGKGAAGGAVGGLTSFAVARLHWQAV